MDGGVDEASTVRDEVETGDAGDAVGVARDGTAGWETGGEGGYEGGCERRVGDAAGVRMSLLEGGAGAFESGGGRRPEDREKRCDATAESTTKERRRESGLHPKMSKKSNARMPTNNQPITRKLLQRLLDHIMHRPPLQRRRRAKHPVVDEVGPFRIGVDDGDGLVGTGEVY